MEDAIHPVAGVDYPQTFQAMDERFRDDDACRDYIRRLRWPRGFVCPHCGAAGEPWAMAGGWLRCRACRKETSLTAGTIFEGTRKPLRMWFLAMWFVTSQKNGVSALGLQRELGLGSYETAWTWLHKLRRAMVRPGRDLLSGGVEVDETYVGGPEEGTRGRETENKAIVAIAAEKNGRGLGRIRLQRIKDVSTDSLLPFSKVPWSLGPLFTPMDGGAMPDWLRLGNSIRSPSSAAASPRLTKSCRASTSSPRCSSGG